MDAKKNRIGGRLREARLSERPKATQEDVSARLATMGVSLSASSIGKIENGTRPVTDHTALRPGEGLKGDDRGLLGETAEKN